MSFELATFALKGPQRGSCQQINQIQLLHVRKASIARQAKILRNGLCRFESRVSLWLLKKADDFISANPTLCACHL